MEGPYLTKTPLFVQKAALFFSLYHTKEDPFGHTLSAIQGLLLSPDLRTDLKEKIPYGLWLTASGARRLQG